MSESTTIPGYIGLIEHIVSQAAQMIQTSGTGHTSFGGRSYSMSPYTGNIVYQIHMKGQIVTKVSLSWFEIECDVNTKLDEIDLERNKKIKLKVDDKLYDIVLKKGENVLGYPDVEKVIHFQ